MPTARICLRRLRRTFSKELSNSIGAEVEAPRRAPGNPIPPTMTYAYFALPETRGEVIGVGQNINPGLGTARKPETFWTGTLPPDGVLPTRARCMAYEMCTQGLRLTT